MELANLEELVDEYRWLEGLSGTRDVVVASAQRYGITREVPILNADSENIGDDVTAIADEEFELYGRNSIL
jgi:hypothetical protein